MYIYRENKYAYWTHHTYMHMLNMHAHTHLTSSANSSHRKTVLTDKHLLFWGILIKSLISTSSVSWIVASLKNGLREKISFLFLVAMSDRIYEIFMLWKYDKNFLVLQFIIYKEMHYIEIFLNLLSSKCDCLDGKITIIKLKYKLF